MTKREMYTNIANLLADNEEVVTFCNREIELLDNRASSKKGMTKKQKENLAVKAQILEVLKGFEEPLTVTEILQDIRMSGYTNQKISALLRQMVQENTVSKMIEGKKTKFYAITHEDESEG